MTPTTDKELRALAEAATGYQWSVFTKGGRPTDLVEVGPDHLISCACTDKPKANAAFIAAANPQTVIGLLDRIEALSEALAPFADRYESSKKEHLITKFLLDESAWEVPLGDLRKAHEALRRAKAGGTDA